MTVEAATPPAPGVRGAYGLAVTGLVPAADDLVASPAGWPRWRVGFELAAGRPAGDWTDLFDAESATIALGTGTARLHRRSASTVLALPAAPTPAELTHPYLSATGAAAAYWRGEIPLHSGAFLTGGRAWGLLGDREAGKSTTVAALWQAGLPILTDDLLVVRGRTGLAGPRCLDLRRPTAEWLRAGTSIGVTGMRERWRIRLDPVPAEVPMGGFVALEWGPALSLTPVPAPQRPALLLAALAVLAPPTDPTALLALFALPVWRLTRPRTLTVLEATTALLAETLGR